LADAEGRMPLHIACYRNSIPVITMLLDAGADINARANGDEDGFTPLISATEHPRVETMAFLLDRGADISALDSYGVTAFWYAAIHGFGDEFADISVLQLLLDRGADINGRDNEGKTVLTAALEFQPPEVISFLRDHGAAE
ncbi:MAG: ankyrin repeat domain-containing protein, partial [Synergistaceae bacterium]|nr:ankyrin repeat domain-containing protein [Synergistaceae bacterium]